MSTAPERADQRKVRRNVAAAPAACPVPRGLPRAVPITEGTSREGTKVLRLPSTQRLRILSLSDYTSLFLFIWRVVWGLVWESKYNKVLSPDERAPGEAEVDDEADVERHLPVLPHRLDQGFAGHTGVDSQPPERGSDLCHHMRMVLLERRGGDTRR